MKLWDAIMIGTVALGATLVAGAQTVFGQDRVEVPLPDVSQLDEAEATELARRIGEVDVITSNCQDFGISGGEWTLLAGTGDLLAQQLGLDPAEYDRQFNAPAYALLDDPEACDRLGPDAKPLIGQLVEMGGATEPAQPEPAEAEEAPAEDGDDTATANADADAEDDSAD
ncbi:hypothetical protein [Paracoccus siganidrum]|nr:hypothetical protein [Paracoccus siganidrum]